MNEGYNPEFNPTGIEGGIDTNALPWIELSQAPGMAIKPLRASIETGVFTVVVQLRKGTELSGLVYLGAMDMMVMAGTTAGSSPWMPCASWGVKSTRRMRMLMNGALPRFGPNTWPL